MKTIELRNSPIDEGMVIEKNIHYVRPTLVAQIGFTEWTPEGHLRHPRFVGLRRDKPAKEVIRES